VDVDTLAEELSKSCIKKFGEMSSEQRLLSIVRQVADASGAIAVRDGAIRGGQRHGYENVPHRVACILAEVLILARKENVDLDRQMKILLKWYQED
jgi:hypothetical protein